MSKFRGYLDDGTFIEGRICYIRAWDDPQWCAQNSLPSPKDRRSAVAVRGAAKRKETMRRRGARCFGG